MPIQNLGGWPPGGTRDEVGYWHVLLIFVVFALLVFGAYYVTRFHDPSPGVCNWDGEVCEENYDDLIEEENLVR